MGSTLFKSFFTYWKSERIPFIDVTHSPLNFFNSNMVLHLYNLRTELWVLGSVQMIIDSRDLEIKLKEQFQITLFKAIIHKYGYTMYNKAMSGEWNIKR